ncbi:MAG TPA: diphthine synthase [Candidatus Nanoarchaeia archaeon]|nr:diphthine synthase [Candidatus Nanoarchaeia archaeon]
MTLNLIGIGLSTEKDITVKGLEIVKKCDKVYLENYTSLLQCFFSDLEKFYGKKIILADRATAEQKDEEIVKEAKNKEIAFLIVGDPFSATTHIELFKLAKEKKVPVQVIHNASVLTAVGITGLQLYKFGKVTSIPFLEDHPNLETPYNVLKENQQQGLHTLFLLDLKPDQQKFMTVNQALEILEKIEAKKKEKLLSKDTLVIGCARLGSEDAVIKSGSCEKVRKQSFGKAPHCLIIPGKMHFSEEEVLKFYGL